MATELNVMNVLNKWAEVVNYDKDQTTFNLLSSNYAFHRAGERIQEILQYDSTGNIAVLYAKYSYESIVKDCKLSLLDLMKDPDCCKDYLDMWNTFEHPYIQKLESDLMYRLKFSSNPVQNALMITGLSDIHETDPDEVSQFRDSIEYVAEQLHQLKLTVFKKSDKAIANKEDIQFVNKLFVFNTIAECLLAIENQSEENFVYLCYISDNNLAGAHFMYLIKSNGNLVGFGDRIDEAYVGAHGQHRNGRWMEDKAFEIFPYGEVMEFEGEDYKGYPKYMKSTTDGLDISELAVKYRYRVILSAILLISRYGGSREHLDSPIKYIHSMLSLATDLDKLEEKTESTNLLSVMNGTQMIDLTKSELVASYNELSTTLDDAFTSENVKSGELTEKFNSVKYAHYTSVNQDIVDAFGDGFELNKEGVLNYSPKLITIGCKDATEIESCTSEYTADIEHMELEMYRQYRKQLADYVQNNLNKHYKEYGGREKIRTWYKAMLMNKFDELVKLAVKLYYEIETRQRGNRPVSWYSTPISQEIVAGYTVNETADWSGSGHQFVLNTEDGSYGRFSYKCPISGCNATIWIQIQPCVLENVVKIIGEDVELPKILTGWANTSSTKGYTGNHILNSCDPVARIRHPLVDGDDRFDFSFTIGLSKKGINKMIKELGLPPINQVKSESL